MPTVSTMMEPSHVLAKMVSAAMGSSVPILTSVEWRTIALSSPAAQTTTVVTIVLARQVSLETASNAKTWMSALLEFTSVISMPTVKILRVETSVPAEPDMPVTVLSVSILMSAQLERTTVTRMQPVKIHQAAFLAPAMLDSLAMEPTVPISTNAIWPTRAEITPFAQIPSVVSLVPALTDTLVTDKIALM